MVSKILQLILFSIGILVHTNAHATQTDSVQIGGVHYKFAIPRKWQLISKDTGICVAHMSNVRIKMPEHVPGAFGEINISISEITYEEREIRRSSDTLPKETNSAAKWSKKKMLSGFKVTNAHLLDQRQIPKAYWDSIQGDVPYSRKQRKLMKKYHLYPMHNLLYLYHFPINDSLEITISFNGDLVQDWNAYFAVDYVAENFFAANRKKINALLISADPYRLEPPITSYDSIRFLNTTLRYPKLDNWIYDTTSIHFDIWTQVMKLTYYDVAPCDSATINVKYRVTKIDNQANKEDFNKLSPEELYKLYKPYKDLNEQERLNYIDSTFQAAKKHYYFAQTRETIKSEPCPTKLENTETIFIVVYTKNSEKIRIAVTLNYVTADFIKERNIRHDLYRYLSLMSSETDFENFYNNSPAR